MLTAGRITAIFVKSMKKQTKVINKIIRKLMNPVRNVVAENKAMLLRNLFLRPPIFITLCARANAQNRKIVSSTQII